MTKKIPLFVGRKKNKYHVVVLNNYLICGTFPHEAEPVLEVNIPLKDIAYAFSVDELFDMLEIRKAMDP